MYPKRQYTRKDANFQATAAKLTCFGINLRNCMFVLNVLNNYILLLITITQIIFKYLRFLGDMHPAGHTLHNVKAFNQDIP